MKEVNKSKFSCTERVSEYSLCKLKCVFSHLDSGAFGYFLRIINWSPVDKSAQQVSNKNSNDIISRDTMH